MIGRLIRLSLITLLGLGLSGLATWGLSLFWIAMGLGVTGTVGLTYGLMALAFKSHREGWDDQVDNTLDPGRGPSRDD